MLLINVSYLGGPQDSGCSLKSAKHGRASVTVEEALHISGDPRLRSFIPYHTCDKITPPPVQISKLTSSKTWENYNTEQCLYKKDLDKVFPTLTLS